MALRDRVVELVRQTVCRGRPFSLGDADSLLENGVVDSLGMITLVDALASRFQITIEDEDLMPENLDSIDAITSFLRRKGVNG